MNQPKRPMFDAKFAKTDRLTRENHGMPWNAEKKEQLRRTFLNGYSLEQMSEICGRKGSSIVKQLVAMGLLRHSYGLDSEDVYHYTSFPKLLPNGNPTPVNPVLIGGKDVSLLDDTKIVDLLINLDSRLNKLNSLSKRPNVVRHEIEHLRSEIDRLVFYVDNRPKDKQL